MASPWWPAAPPPVGSAVGEGATSGRWECYDESTSRLLEAARRDGAGAIVLGAEDSAVTDPATARGILASKLHADGRHNQLLYVDGGPSTTQTVGKLRMKGQEVFRHAVVNLAAVLTEVMGIAGLSATDIDWLVPHQANARILDATARKLKLSFTRRMRPCGKKLRPGWKRMQKKPYSI